MSHVLTQIHHKTQHDTINNVYTLELIAEKLTSVHFLINFVHLRRHQSRVLSVNEGGSGGGGVLLPLSPPCLPLWPWGWYILIKAYPLSGSPETRRRRLKPSQPRLPGTADGDEQAAEQQLLVKSGSSGRLMENLTGTTRKFPWREKKEVDRCHTLGASPLTPLERSPSSSSFSFWRKSSCWRLRTCWRSWGSSGKVGIKFGRNELQLCVGWQPACGRRETCHSRHLF